MEASGSLTEFAFVLAAACAGGAVLNKFKQPVLVGYVLAGIILGPSVLGFVHDTEQIRIMAEFGILLLLFIVGIELDLKKFAPVYRVAVITTIVQIGTSLFVMMLLGWLFQWSMERVLLLSFAVSLSSTAVAIKLLQDMGEIHTNAGRTAIGILIAQDIAVIPMLLVVDAMGGEGFHPTDFIKIVLAVGFLAGVILLLKKKSEWFKRFIPEAASAGQTTIAAMAFCFLASALAGMVGLSAAYGSFLAGLIIGNTSKSQSFEENIKPIFDVLIMVFFLSVGLLIDLSFVIEKLGTILTLLFLVMFIKTFINIGMLRILGMRQRHAYVMGSVLGQIGEFSLVLAAVGLSGGMIVEEGYKYVISVTALSLVCTPFWLYGIRRARLLKRNKRFKELKKMRFEHFMKTMS